MGHKHAHLMVEYAKDALETDKPWTRWERRDPEYGAAWLPIVECPVWLLSWEYRRKPRTMTYTITIPKPLLEAPTDGSKYFVAMPHPNGQDFCYQFTWDGTQFDVMWLARGLCFATKEDAIAAAKAMMPIKEEA